MQRVRVGLTGLGAVLLIVAVSAAIFESARKQPGDNVVAANASQAQVANMVGNTAADVPSDPLTEIGVTPAGPPATNVVIPVAPPPVPASVAPAPGSTATPPAPGR
ncbi:hypothetical protein [Sphingomonas sp.]|uniref:hypothetical protein n=1 Tax=Sphingomonas sp. TaxID=28214 RepID=UPI002DBB51E9|nr:hypothetical protein [Sphingomonas sp.]HEU4968285.1 hypothetical protein [Sphingomonas sp.]